MTTSDIEHLRELIETGFKHTTIALNRIESDMQNVERWQNLHQDGGHRNHVTRAELYGVLTGLVALGVAAVGLIWSALSGG